MPWTGWQTRGVPRLLDELVLAQADGRLPRLMAAWARVDVLVLDDLGLQPVPSARAADLLEVIEDRAGTRSTIVTSQLPVGHWHEALGDPTVADAILGCGSAVASLRGCAWLESLPLFDAREG